MYYLLFIFYLVIGYFAILHIPFIRNAGLGIKMTGALFLLKIAAGIFVGWMANRYFPFNDYWGMNKEGINEYHLMLSDPKEFFTNIFRSPYHHYDGFFNSVGSYWNDLKNNLILKLLAICNIFSGGNYYINSLFLNFFGFFGHVALYRVFSDIYKNKKWPVITGCFLLPSTLYYSSAIYKDLFVFTMLGLFLYAIYFSFQQKFTTKRVIVICLTAICLLLIRNYVFVALIPPVIAFMICSKKRWNPLIIFGSTYAGIFLLIFLLQWLTPSFQPLKIITHKQQDFFDLPIAGSQLNTNTLEPNLKSFLMNFPQAVNHGFMRPTTWESSRLLMPLALELLAYQCLFIGMLFLGSARNSFNKPFILFALFFSISMILITGYIIPNMGSIVRYRSLYLPLLITPIICAINWKNYP